MYPPSFSYYRPETLDHAVELLEEHSEEDVKILAGGQSLIPLMKLRFAQPKFLVDINGIQGLEYIREEAGWTHIGALTREADLEHADRLRETYPIIIDTAEVIADPLVRSVATLGGNLAHADPANDHPATMVALNATVASYGPGGYRSIPVMDLFEGLMETTLGASEILTEVRIPPLPPESGTAYVKFERQVGDFAIAAAAACLQFENRTITSARLALTNVATKPYRATSSEEFLVGKEATEDVVREAGLQAVIGLQMWDDIRGSAAYRARVSSVVAERALALAALRAKGGDST